MRLDPTSEMVVRLAYERGYLTTRNPNRLQRWGLVYFLYMDRRQHNDDLRQIQELQTFELFPERWKQLHGLVEDTEVVDGQEYEGVQDPRELDDWLEKNAARLEQPREMSGADLAYYGMEV